jgi:transposase-like protein
MNSTSPKNNVARLARGADFVQEAQSLGSEGMTMRQLLGLMLSVLGEAERKAFLAQMAGDKGNGAYDRSLVIGSVPVDVRVPRTRSGGFRPTLLPPPYQRGYSSEMEPLLLNLLLSSRSISSAKTALRRLGVPVPEKELDGIAGELVEELDLTNSRPVDPDVLAVYLDGKYVEIKEADRIRPATIYVVVALARNGRKRVLCCVPRPGRESLEEWKKILRGLVERGLRRVMLVVHDDFSGLLPVTKGLFPTADIQLCIVHMQRNGRSHLGKEDAAEFQKRVRAIKACWDLSLGTKQFDDLCDRFAKTAPTFIAELRKKRDHYLAFLAYPDPIRRSLSTTNAVEAVNGQLERLRLNSGGYFQSETVLKLKLSAAVIGLERERWAKPAAIIAEALPQMNVLFQTRFETEES